MKNNTYYIPEYHGLVFCHDYRDCKLTLSGCTEYLNDSKTSLTRQKISFKDFKSYNPILVRPSHVEFYAFLEQSPTSAWRVVNHKKTIRFLNKAIVSSLYNKNENVTIKKEELLKDPMVKQICEDYLKTVAKTPGNRIFSLEESNWIKFIEDQEPKKEWEITDILKKGSRYIPNDGYKGHHDVFLNMIGPNADYNIYSVKRSSDGVEFKIGDKITWSGEGDSEVHTITSFNAGSCNVTWNKTSVSIMDISMAREPLFKTEDGVEIFEGDDHVRVGLDFITHSHKAHSHMILAGGYFKEREKFGFTFFSTKEAAEQYILENKPCLSYKDIERTLDFNSTLAFFDELKEIKKIAKQKTGL